MSINGGFVRGNGKDGLVVIDLTPLAMICFDSILVTSYEEDSLDKPIIQNQ